MYPLSEIQQFCNLAQASNEDELELKPGDIIRVRKMTLHCKSLNNRFNEINCDGFSQTKTSVLVAYTP